MKHNGKFVCGVKYFGAKEFNPLAINEKKKGMYKEEIHVEREREREKQCSCNWKVSTQPKDFLCITPKLHYALEVGTTNS
jgi:hypothetical protein